VTQPGDLHMRVLAVQCKDCGEEIAVDVNPASAESIPHFIAQVVAECGRVHQCPKKGTPDAP
jgi:hypothetical protein